MARTSSSNATPELADKVGKRLLVMNEPEHDDVVNAGIMKELTGQDRIMARPLYGKPFYYIPQFIPILPCNQHFDVRILYVLFHEKLHIMIQHQ